MFRLILYSRQTLTEMAQKQQKRKGNSGVSLFSKEGLSMLRKFEDVRHTGRYLAGFREEASITNGECSLTARLRYLVFNTRTGYTRDALFPCKGLSG